MGSKAIKKIRGVAVAGVVFGCVELLLWEWGTAGVARRFVYDAS